MLIYILYNPLLRGLLFNIQLEHPFYKGDDQIGKHYKTWKRLAG